MSLKFNYHKLKIKIYPLIDSNPLHRKCCGGSSIIFKLYSVKERKGDWDQIWFTQDKGLSQLLVQPENLGSKEIVMY